MIFHFWPTIIFITTYHLSAHHDFLGSSRSNVTVSKATSGCGSTPAWQFDAHNHANITTGDRSFLVHIPASYDPTIPHAVVLSFHGYKGSDLKQEKISGFSEKGIKLNGKGIIAVYPNGKLGPGKNGNESHRAWQGAPYSSPGVDDIAFAEEIVQQLQSNLCVDNKRIYASGKSNGGGFTNLLACTPSTAKMFAAFASVSAALYSGANPADCHPGRPIPIINFHGLADNMIHFHGRSADKRNRTEYATPSITHYREAWAIRDGCRHVNCSTSPSLGVDAVISYPHKDTVLKQYICSTSNSDAVVYGFSINYLGHSWPSTSGLDGEVTDFDATTDILTFFEQHTLT